MKKVIKGKRLLLISAYILSAICNPVGIPFVGFLALFIFSYLRLLPLQYKLIVLGIIYSFTVLLPSIAILLYKKINGWSMRELENRKNRIIPYVLVIMSYAGCLLMMERLNMPRYLSGIVISSLMSMTICTFINYFWKISAHMAGMGQLIGVFLSFSLIFHYNPIVWLCIFILLAGLLGTGSIIIRQHTLAQVLAGVCVGLSCGILGILFI